MAGGSDALAHDPADGDRRPVAWRDLGVRVASAVVLAPVGLAAVWWGGLAWDGLILIVTFGMAREWAAMMHRRHLGRGQAFLTGLCYIGPASVALIWMRADPEFGLGRVLFGVLVVWASDIGAYAAGRLFGGPRLAPVISPGKTWSGAVGGLVSAMAVGLAASLIDSDAPVHAMLSAGMLGLAAQLGDLLESAFKRYFGVKDSGTLIPGHGGLLDRLDGMLLAAPLAAILTLLDGRGAVLW